MPGVTSTYNAEGRRASMTVGVSNNAWLIQVVFTLLLLGLCGCEQISRTDHGGSWIRGHHGLGVRLVIVTVEGVESVGSTDQMRRSRA